MRFSECPTPKDGSHFTRQEDCLFPKVFGYSACRNKIKFTMVELLVTISIILILAGILLPALAGARRKAHEIACNSNQRQIGLATFTYALDNDDRVPPMIDSATGDSWQEHLAPYLNFEWNISKPTPEIFRCPSRPLGDMPSAYDSMIKSDYGASFFLITNATWGDDVNVVEVFRLSRTRHPSITVWTADVRVPGGNVWSRMSRGTEYEFLPNAVYRHPGNTIILFFLDGSVRKMNYYDMQAQGYFIDKNWRYGWRDGMIYL